MDNVSKSTSDRTSPGTPKHKWVQTKHQLHKWNWQNLWSTKPELRSNRCSWSDCVWVHEGCGKAWRSWSGLAPLNWTWTLTSQGSLPGLGHTEEWDKNWAARPKRDLSDISQTQRMDLVCLRSLLEETKWEKVRQWNSMAANWIICIKHLSLVNF